MYRTPKEQIELLTSRGLKFKKEEFAEKILKKINYYNIINPYGKLFFKEKDLYIEGTYFEHIYSFYKFDKKLSGLFLVYILHIESSLKTAISHVVSSKGDNGHKEESYLDISIFEDKNSNITPEQREDNEKFIEDLKEKINSSKKEYIKHNRRVYSNVPFWVLCNEMYFSEAIYYYEKLVESDRNRVSLIMRGDNMEVKLTLNQFQSAIYMIRDLRNLIAHDEVVYWFKPLNDKGQPRYYGFNKYKGVSSQMGSIATIILIFNMYLDKENWEEFYYIFEKLLKSLYDSIPKNIFNEIIRKMGFYNILQDNDIESSQIIEEISKIYNLKKA